MKHDTKPLKPDKRDYYADLGLDESALQADLRKAYRKLAMQHHPDRKDRNLAKFKQIQVAFDYLKDLKDGKRANYLASLPRIRQDWAQYRRIYAEWWAREEMRRQQKRLREEREAAAKGAARQKLENAQKERRRRREQEVQNRENERIRRDQAEHARAAEARMKRDQEAEEARRQAQEEKTKNGGVYTGVRVQTGSEREEEDEQYWTANEEHRRQQDEAHDRARKAEKQRIADERSKRAAEAARVRQAESAKRRLQQAEAEGRLRERKTSKGPSSARGPSARAVKMQMARTWVRRKHHECLVQARGREKSLLGEQIEIGWTKKDASGKCDFCGKIIRHYMFECPNGGAVACWPCKNGLSTCGS